MCLCSVRVTRKSLGIAVNDLYSHSTQVITRKPSYRDKISLANGAKPRFLPFLLPYNSMQKHADNWLAIAS